MPKTNPKVDGFLRYATKWQSEMKALRQIVLDCQLGEELKWGQPCYTLENNNIVLIHAFKKYCALLFFKGVLLKDRGGILIQQTKNSQSQRQIRFTSVEQIVELETAIRDYIQEAVEVERAGLKVALKKTTEFAVPDEFQDKLDRLPALKTAFAELTPGRQRGYLLYFSAAKQAATRESRVAKCIPRIFDGKGLDD